jgi:MFS family permease
MPSPLTEDPPRSLGRRVHPQEGAPSSPAAPPPSSAVRRAYLDLGINGYMLYGIGAVSAYLRERLALSDAETGLHSSAMAIGMVGAGLVADRLDRRLGPRVAHAAALLLVALSAMGIAWSPAFAVTLASAAGVGFSVGLLLGHANATLAAGGGGEARVRLGRANLLAMLTALAVPFVIAAGVAVGLGWQAVVVPPLVAVLVALAAVPGRVGLDQPGLARVRSRLPRAFWLAWILVVLVVSVEFSGVFWGSTLVQRRTGVPLDDATLVLAAFFGGMLLGRVGLSLPVGGAQDPIRLMRVSLVVALVGSVLAWLSTAVWLSAAGLLLAGLGVAVLYPVGVAVTLAASGGHPSVAAARLTLASGTAILVAPLVLGAVTDVVGVLVGWLIIPGLCVAALAMTWVVTRDS